MREYSRKAILLGITTIPVNAVVFTSRAEKEINGFQETIIRPNTISGNRLSSFVEAYLTNLGKKELFADEEFFNGCRALSAMLNNREITALLAKLFVEQMVAKKEKVISETWPHNIPELMLQSLEILYNATPVEGLALRDVISSAKIVAWECIKIDYKPLAIEYQRALDSLSHLKYGEEALKFLIDKLKIIETVSFDAKIRFKMDPLAEYLAGLRLVEENKDDRGKWRLFVDSMSSKQNSDEFFVALWECCMMEDVKNHVPGFVFEALAKAVKTWQLKTGLQS
jgi:hypothetical protein